MVNSNFVKGLSIKELFIVLAILISGIVYVFFVYGNTLRNEKEYLIQIARSVEVSLPKGEIQSLPENPEELPSKEFIQLKKSLQQIIQVNRNARFAYLYLQRSDRLYFIVDSEPESSPDYSPAGQEFTEAEPIDSKPFQDGKALVTDPVTDRWGTWVSAEVPIVDDSTGKVIAVFGMDYDAKSWRNKILFEVAQSSLLVIIILILAFAGIFRQRRNEQLKREISLREVAEKGLKESESDYRLLFELNPQPMLVYDMESMMILTVNQATIDKYSYSKEEFLEMSILDLKSSDEFVRLWKNLIEDKHSLQRLEIWNHRLKDGSTIQVEVHSHNFDFRHKDARLVLLIDITESLKTKVKIRANERHMTSLINNLPGIVYRCALDEDFTMNYISEGCTRITGYTPEDFMTKEIAYNDLILPEYRDPIWQKWQEVIHKKLVFEEEYPIINISGDIKWIWERGGGVFDENGELEFLEGYLEDITINKLAEEKLLQSEANLARTIGESPFGIRILSGDGTTLYANPALLEIFGFDSLNDFNHIPVSSWYTPECYLEYLAREASRKNGEDIQLDYEVRIISKKFGIRHLFVHRQQILWNGDISNLLIYQDITEKKKNEVELIKAKEKAEESDRLKSAFLANISHEIRTPMNGIMGFAELLKEPDLSPENQQGFIEVIEQSGQRMLNIINDLIDISKIEAGETILRIRETNVNKMLHELHLFFMPEVNQKNIYLDYHCDLSDDESIIETDITKLNQILTNLIKNAVKFTDKGSIKFGYKHKDKMLEFYIADTGPGIPQEQKDFIFERFRQGTQSLNKIHEGAGLGLAISKAYVELLGGSIWIESEFGKGSTFSFDTPIRHQHP